MTKVLTHNGILPQIIGSLNEEQRANLVVLRQTHEPTPNQGYFYEKKAEWQPHLPEPMHSFRNLTDSVERSFVAWGATFLAAKISFVERQLRTGETTFGDKGLHSDSNFEMENLMNEGKITIRLLTVSSHPAHFLDLTSCDNLKDILETHKVSHSHRHYSPRLKIIAQSQDATIQPNPWDVMLFDATTPHQPEGVLSPEQRVLLNAWIKMKLPEDWRQRLTSSDGPRLMFG